MASPLRTPRRADADESPDESVAAPPKRVAARDEPPGGLTTSAIAGRMGWTLAGVTLLLWSLDLFGYVDNFTWLSPIMVLLTVWGFGTILVSWVPGVFDRRLGLALAWTTVALVVLGFVVWSYTQIAAAPAYGTDEVAFDQYAAQLVIHGMNPYVHSMAPAFSAFHVAPNAFTFRLSGQPVTQLSYPALSFLVYAPFVAAGWTTQLAVWMNVGAWALGIVLAFALLPRRVRPLALVVGSLGIYVSYAVGGITDALFVPLLVGAAYQWDRFGVTSGWRAWRGPVLLGLAMAVKQTPWLVLPFLVGGIGIEAWERGAWRLAARTAGRYLAIALGVFLLPNLPFIVANPHGWFSGVVTPIFGNEVPAGQGLVGLSLFLGIGGGSLTAYTVTLIVAFIALWALYVAVDPVLKAWAVLCPAVILFFSARSFGSYLVTLVPAAMVAACSVSRSTGRAPWRGWPWVAIGGVGATLAGLVFIFSYGSPIGLAITAVHTSGQLATIESVHVQATNRTAHPIQPAFSVESGGTITAFWIQSGPRRLAPGESADYRLLAPNFSAQPPISSAFQVVAFTNGPGSVSISRPFSATTLHLSLNPDHIDHYVAVGTPVTVRAQLLNALNEPVERSGVPVYLGQIIYAQQGALLSQASVNGSPPGRTPVPAFTNDHGVATFVIRGTNAPANPVYFEANLVNATQYFPYGYSQILPIRLSRP
jgi:hypothetical protein